MRIAFSCLLFLAVASAAHAASSCEQAANQAALNQCVGQAYKDSDAELNKVYTTVMGRLKDDKALSRRLVAAQRAWVAFRDAECGFQTAGTEGGSAHSMAVAMCLDGQTRARTDTLRTYLECEEGSLNCPVPAQ
ncbi:lysozyme inhibitor LprI family protein [Bordetella flabilis]|uniref:Lysozyme inhibitor LprI-like N-terminal domain-containing protein n=1 Tax=Bordetella flabilis TaxID=463014 RepID=A0A193G8U8_9BORD|nr:lysozyme inhibitor LprI family protein [Bordetella flabilis]ANN76412.1 hypothetical protein BAU07_04125 [Bordetella flabilis]